MLFNVHQASEYLVTYCALSYLVYNEGRDTRTIADNINLLKPIGYVIHQQV